MKLFGVYFCIQFVFLEFTLTQKTEFTKHIIYDLYTSTNPKNPQVIKLYDYFSIKKSNYNTRLRTKIMIHGWIPDFDKRYTYVVRDAYLGINNVNFIEVNWTYYSRLDYPVAVKLLPRIGEEIAKLVDYLNVKFKLDFDETIVLGHSLGAHVAGFTGKYVKRGKIAGIVGLDAAQLLITYEIPGTHLEVTDAKYVETLHVTTFRGTLMPIGNVSFYPNWGRELPGCNEGNIEYCSHEKAPALYAAAIRGNPLGPYYKCKSFENIVEKTDCNELALNAKIGDPLDIVQVMGIYYLEIKDGDI